MRYSIFILFCWLTHFAFSQCEQPSIIRSYNLPGNNLEVHSLANSPNGFTATGRVQQNGAWDYFFSEFDNAGEIQEFVRIQSSFNDDGNPITHCQLIDGNYLLAGYSSVGGSRILKLICFSPTNIIWERQMEGNYETPRIAYPTSDGGAIVLGSSESFSNGSSDAFALKVSSDGAVDWKRGIGASNNEHFFDGDLSFDGQFVFVGNNQSYSGTHRPALCVLDDAGNYVLNRVYSGTGLALFTSITKDEDSYYCSGYAQFSGSTFPLIMKLDSDYEVVWSRTYTSPEYGNATAAEITFGSNGNLFTSIKQNPGTGYLEMFAIVNPETGAIENAANIDDEIQDYTVSNIGGYQANDNAGGFRVLGNNTSDDGFAALQFNSCLNNGDCLIEAPMNDQNYSSSAIDYYPNERDLQDLIETSDFQIISDFDLIASTNVCNLNPCPGTLTIPDLTGCVGEWIDFFFELENEDSGIYSYYMSFEDGTGSYGLGTPLDIIPILYDSELSQEYTLLLSLENGCEYTASGTITVVAPPSSPDIATDVLLCQGEEFELNASDYPEWEITDAEGSLIDSFVTDEPGTYNFTFSSQCAVEEFEILIDEVIPSEYIDFSDQIICTGDEVSIEVSDWQSIDEESEIQVSLGGNFPVIYAGEPLDFNFTEEGNYTLNISGFILNCPVDIEFQVEVIAPPGSFLENSHTICEGEVLNFDFSDLGFDVIGPNGSMVESAQITTGGTFTFTGQNSCSSFEEVINVDEIIIDPSDFGNSQFICPGEDSISIGFNDSGYDFFWENGSQNNSLVVSTPGEYSVTVSDTAGLCTESYSFSVFPSEPEIYSIFDSSEVVLCEEGVRSVILPNLSYDITIEGDIVNGVFHPEESGILTAYYYDGCYEITDTLLVTLETCLCPIFIPNVFTPNEDGLNDIFRPTMECEPESFEMIIFNRWGTEIYQTNDLHKGWNGSSPNEDFYATAAIYIYIIKTEEVLDGVRYPNVYQGNVTLLR